MTVDRDETWVQQLVEGQKERFTSQAQEMYKEYLADLHSVGPFATERRKELEQRYEERLNEIKQLQQEELDYYIEMERQQRLWSIGQQDASWEGWSGVVAEQERLFAHIKRDSARSREDPWDKHEKTRENQREAEGAFRRNEAWQRSETQRMRDRQRWLRDMNIHMEARRTQDRADFEAQQAQTRAMDEQSTRLAEESRESAARLRARASQSTLYPGFDTARVPPIRSPVSESSSRSSATESIFSSSRTADTAPSSVGNDRSDATPRPSASRPFPIPTSAQDGARHPAAGSFGGPSPSSRTRPPSTSSQASPLSGTPMSAKMGHGKNDQPVGATVWMPSSVREPGSSSRRVSEQSDGTKVPPAKTSSLLFGASPGPPPPQPLADPPRESEKPRPVPTPQTQAYTSQPQPMRATPSQTSFHAPNAPGARSHPLPDTPPKSQFGTSPASHSSFSSMFPETKHSSSAGASASSPVNSGTQSTFGAAKQPTSPADGYKDRAKVRAEYVRKEEERVEEERKRREQEANERRAEDARRRGAEKRRQEEQAREAERREAERKTRKTSINSMRLVPDRSVLEVWNAYESGWAAMTTATQLRFRSIPWPTLNPVSSPEMLLPIQIAAFILNPQHSQGKSRKDRLREALLRWHPDRFESKWLNKVAEEDRDSVKEGVGCVVRALNDLLSAEGTFAA
jgi:hypothetical protein